MAGTESLSSSAASFWSSASGEVKPPRTSADSPRVSNETEGSVRSSTSTPGTLHRTPSGAGSHKVDGDARSTTSTLSAAGQTHQEDANSQHSAPSVASPHRAEITTSEAKDSFDIGSNATVGLSEEPVTRRSDSPQSTYSQRDETVIILEDLGGAAEPINNDNERTEESAPGSFDTTQSNKNDESNDGASVERMLPTHALTARSTSSYPPSSHKAESPKGSISSAPLSKNGPSAAEVTAAPPDGGWRAWLTVLGGFLVLFSSFGVVNALGAFQAYYEEYLFPTRSSSEIAWIGSTQLCLFFLCALVAGPLFDKGYFRSIVAFGSALWLLSIFLIPEAKTYGQMMGVQGILGGVGVGFLFLPCMSIQSHWFARRRALAIGIVASGSSVGGICFPIMLNRLFANPSVGFEKGVRACGYVVLACLVIANLIMRPNPARKHIHKPPPPPLKEMFSGPFTCLVLGAFLLSFGIWFPNFYEQLWFQASGASPQIVTYALAFFNAGSFFGRIIPNLIADYIGPFNVQFVCCFGAGIMIFLTQVMGHSDALLVLHAVLYGFFSGAYIALVSPITVSISKDLSEIGLRQGIAFLVVAGSSVACNPIAGSLLTNHNGDFLPAIVFAGTMVLVGSTFMATGRMLRAKEKGTWRV